MTKKILSALLILGMVSSPILAKAAESARVYPTENGAKARGYSYGTRNNYGADGASITESYDGSAGTFYAYVEIVNSQGWRIGDGAERYSTSRAYSGTITRAGGSNTNIQGTHGFNSARVDSRVY